MGIFDSIKESAKKAIDVAKENYQRSQEIKSWKEAVVVTLTFSQIKQLCNEYGSNPKPYTVDSITGDKEKRPLDRDAYEDFIVSEVPSKFILKFVQEHRIDAPPYPKFKENKITQQVMQEPPSNDVSPNESSKKPETKTETNEVNAQNASKIDTNLNNFNIVMNYIDNEFREHIKSLEISGEDDFGNILLTSLHAKFPGMNIKDVRNQHNRGDITIADQYVFELKYANNEGTLNKGLKEVRDYYKLLHYKGVAIIILNIDLLGVNKINEYAADYKEDGAKIIILNAKARPTPKKDEYVVFKKKR